MYPYQAPPPTRRPFYRRHKVTTAFGGLVLLALVASVGASVAGSGDVTPVPSSSSSISQAAVPVVGSSQAVTVPAVASSPVQSAPAMTGAEQQAVQSAQGYLSDGRGFSRAGLLDQLTSNNGGEGFARTDAEFAIGYLKPDWNAQAVESAKVYLADGQGFSRAGLLDQLTSNNGGDGFTAAQAEYAVNKVGL